MASQTLSDVNQWFKGIRKGTKDALVLDEEFRMRAEAFNEDIMEGVASSTLPFEWKLALAEIAGILLNENPYVLIVSGVWVWTHEFAPGADSTVFMIYDFRNTAYMIDRFRPMMFSLKIFRRNDYEDDDATFALDVVYHNYLKDELLDAEEAKIIPRFGNELSDPNTAPKIFAERLPVYQNNWRKKAMYNLHSNVILMIKRMLKK